MPAKHKIKISVCYVSITPLCRVNYVCRFETRFILLRSYAGYEINGEGKHAVSSVGTLNYSQFV